MAVWSPLTTHWSVTTDCSRRPASVDSIGHHHAASTNLYATLQLFQPGGREVSPNYLIYRDQIWGIVPEDMRAWTSSSAVDDGRSITYEIINSSGGPDWSFDPVTLDTVKRLDADIMRRYGIRATHAIPGFWEHKDLNIWFGRSYPTACAGPSFNIGQIIAGAAQYAGGVIPTPVPPTPPNTQAWAFNPPDRERQRSIQVGLAARGRYDGPKDGIWGVNSVKGIQKTIRNVGYDGPIDGIAGPNTCYYVQVYARRFGGYTGPLDKVCGPNTWAGFDKGLNTWP